MAPNKKITKSINQFLHITLLPLRIPSKISLPYLPFDQKSIISSILFDSIHSGNPFSTDGWKTKYASPFLLLTNIPKITKLLLGRGKHWEWPPTEKSLNRQIKFYTGFYHIPIFLGNSIYIFDFLSQNQKLHLYFSIEFIAAIHRQKILETMN
jgi:hypothetical protein